MQLTRLHNYGAAWSSLSGRTVLLVVFTAVLLAAVALLLIKRWCATGRVSPPAP